MNDIVLKDENDEIFTTSVLIAEKFGKRHKVVLRKIDNLSESTVGRLKIVPSSYLNEQGKEQRMYRLNRDAFSFIAMGFTGAEADDWKLSFIDAFNKMERHLRRLVNKEWKEYRAQAALEYKAMSRTLEEVRKLAGKETMAHHYINEAKLVNWALTGEFKRIERAALDKASLDLLAELEMYNAVLIGAGHDREIRKTLLKQRCSQLSSKLLQ